MAEFFLSTDFGILLCVFFFGVAISGRLAAWVRAIHARFTAMVRRSVRYRMHVAEADIRNLDNRDDVIFSRLDELERMIKFSDYRDLEERMGNLENWICDGNSTAKTVEFIKKKAEERASALKKIN